MSDHEFKKKETPQPLERALEKGVAPRPVSPTQRLAVPLGIAAALVLSTGAAATYAMTRGATVAHESASNGNVFSRLIDDVKDFVDPNRERPHVAGGMEPAPPGTGCRFPAMSASTIAPVADPPPPPGAPPATRPVSSSTPIVPRDDIQLDGLVARPTRPEPPPQGAKR